MAFRPWEYRTETGSAGVRGRPDRLLRSPRSTATSVTWTRRPTSCSASSYLVVDTGPWIFGRTVMLPAGVVERIDTAEKKIYVDRTKDQIKNAPEYDERADDAKYRDRLGGYYAEPYNTPDTRM